MIPNILSPRDELAEPLRALVSDIASDPTPEELLLWTRTFRVAVSRKNVQTRRSVSAVLVSLLAVGICLMALVIRENPPEPEKIAKESQPAPGNPLEELPPPSLWAYRQAAHSPEALDELLTRHALVLLPSSQDVSLHPFSRKEEL